MKAIIVIAVLSTLYPVSGFTREEMKLRAPNKISLYIEGTGYQIKDPAGNRFGIDTDNLDGPLLREIHNANIVPNYSGGSGESIDISNPESGIYQIRAVSPINEKYHLVISRRNYPQVDTKTIDSFIFANRQQVYNLEYNSALTSNSITLTKVIAPTGVADDITSCVDIGKIKDPTFAQTLKTKIQQAGTFISSNKPLDAKTTLEGLLKDIKGAGVKILAPCDKILEDDTRTLLQSLKPGNPTPVKEEPKKVEAPAATQNVPVVAT